MATKSFASIKSNSSLSKAFNRKLESESKTNQKRRTSTSPINLQR